MSERRLSKLQKWILENCFRVTVLLDRSTLNNLKNIGNGWKCRDCPKTKGIVRIERSTSGFFSYQCLKEGHSFSRHCSYFHFYKEDVLLSFFGLLPDNNTIHISRVQHFHDSPGYAKAHVTTHRSINSLSHKGLIYAFKFAEYSLQISLTDDGMKKAAELLGITDFKVPVES